MSVIERQFLEVAMPARHVVYESDLLRATCLAPENKRLVVTFDNFRSNRTGFARPHESNLFVRSGWANLQIHTRHNDWFLNKDTESLRAALYEFTRHFKVRRALGFSMGAYGVLRLADVLRLQSGILVSPQLTPLADVMPFDQRYQMALPLIDQDEDHIPLLSEAGEWLILVDPSQSEDMLHARMILHRCPKSKLSRLPFGGHPATQVIHEAKMFGRIQMQLLADDMSGPSITRLHRALRSTSTTYQQNLASWTNRRCVIYTAVSPVEFATPP
jgi:hypothetical protein